MNSKDPKIMALEIQLKRVKDLAPSHLLDCAIMECPITPTLLPVPYKAFNYTEDDAPGDRLLEYATDVHCRWDIESELKRLERHALLRHMWFVGSHDAAYEAFCDFAKELGRLLWERPRCADAGTYSDSCDIHLRWLYELHRQACEGFLPQYATGRCLWVANLDLDAEFFSPPPAGNKLLWWNYNRYGSAGPYEYSHENKRVASLLSLYAIPHDRESAIYHTWDYAKDGESFWRKLPLEDKWLPSPKEPHPRSITHAQADSILRRHSYVEILNVFSASCQALQSIIDSMTPHEEPSERKDAALKESSRHTPAKWKNVIRQQIKAEIKSMLGDDVLVKAYLEHGSYRKAADALSRQQESTVFKDQVARAVKRAGGIDALRRTESSKSIQRPSHRRDS